MGLALPVTVQWTVKTPGGSLGVQLRKVSLRARAAYRLRLKEKQDGFEHPMKLQFSGCRSVELARSVVLSGYNIDQFFVSPKGKLQSGSTGCLSGYRSFPAINGYCCHPPTHSDYLFIEVHQWVLRVVFFFSRLSILALVLSYLHPPLFFLKQFFHLFMIPFPPHTWFPLSTFSLFTQ